LFSFLACLWGNFLTHSRSGLLRRCGEIVSGAWDWGLLDGIRDIYKSLVGSIK
jgi:hypothetical protein